MSKLKLYNIDGTASGDIELADELLVLGAGEQAVHDVVVATRNAARQGSASSKHKGEVAGSNKKPWRQKGTGRARAGYRQSPIWRGGAAAFGPKPRSYAVKVNKKVSRLAFGRAFSEKVLHNQVMVLDSLTMAEPKTKLFKDL
ncbi:MAG: 50S ribosomal protein L4, partial [Kiritimatiellae bacterium]|nr:50S ribosomal protein L4 [Kiritimatiellia bacterium]